MDFSKRLDEIEALLRKQYALNKEILTLEEAADFLSLSKSAIYKLTSKKEIPYYTPGGKKIFFKRIELENWVLTSKSVSVGEVDDEISSYLSRTQKSKL